MAITEGTIGSEGQYSLVYKEGKLIVELGYAGTQAEAGMYLRVKVVDIIQALIDSTETKLDNALLDPVLSALR